MSVTSLRLKTPEKQTEQSPSYPEGGKIFEQEPVVEAIFSYLGEFGQNLTLVNRKVFQLLTPKLSPKILGAYPGFDVIQTPLGQNLFRKTLDLPLEEVEVKPEEFDWVLTLLEGITQIHGPLKQIENSDKGLAILTCSGKVFYQEFPASASRNIEELNLVKVPERIEKLAIGTFHLLMISESKTLYGYGNNTYHEVSKAPGDHYQTPVITDPEFEQGVLDVAGGVCFSLILTAEKKVLAIGQNASGQLGIEGVHIRSNELVELEGKGVVSLACGDYHCLALTENGEVYSWGGNMAGGLGRGEMLENGYEPGYIEALHGKKIVQIEAKMGFSAALDNTGDVYIWGHFCTMSNPIEALYRPQKLDLLGEKGEAIKASSRHLEILTKSGKLLFFTLPFKNHPGPFQAATSLRSFFEPPPEIDFLPNLIKILRGFNLCIYFAGRRREF